MLKPAVLFVVGALSVAGIAAASPQGVAGYQGQFRNTPIGRLFTGQAGRAMVLRSKLNVTDEQRSAIAIIIETHRGELTQTVANIVKHKRALRDVAKDITATEQDIRRVAGELANAMGDAALVGQKMHRDMQGVWTAEQKKLLDTFQLDKREAVDGWLSEIAVQ